ncbi:MAG: Mov34/MPN/PAD-1 family protein [Chthoniobacterales bacterium]
MRDACDASRRQGREICGLLVDTGFALSFVSVPNASRRGGSFIFSKPDVRRISAAAATLGQQVVGTFHAHPVADATPGESDIRNTFDDSLMFIFDCADRKGRLWRIKRQKAKELKFRVS